MAIEAANGAVVMCAHIRRKAPKRAPAQERPARCARAARSAVPGARFTIDGRSEAVGIGAEDFPEAA